MTLVVFLAALIGGMLIGLPICFALLFSGVCIEGAHRRHVGDDGVGRRGRRVFVFAVQHRQDVLDGVRVGGAGVVRRGVPLLPPLGGGDDAAVRVFVPVRVEHDHGVLFSVPAV